MLLFFISYVFFFWESINERNVSEFTSFKRLALKHVVSFIADHWAAGSLTNLKAFIKR
jgi:hypothetical protein